MWNRDRFAALLLHPGRIGTLLEKNLTLRLATALVSAVLVLLIILQLFSRLYFSRTLLNMAVAMQERNLAYAEESMKTRLRETEQVVYELAIDLEFRNRMVQMDAVGQDGQARLFSLIRDQLRDVVEQREDVVTITMVTRSGRTVNYDRLAGSNTTNLWADAYMGDKEAIRTRSLDEPHIFYAVAPAKVHNLACYHAVLNIWDFYTHESIGTLVFTLDGQYLNRSLADPSQAAPRTVGVPDWADDMLEPMDGAGQTGSGIGSGIASGSNALRDDSEGASGSSAAVGSGSSLGSRSGFVSNSGSNSGSDSDLGSDSGSGTDSHQLILLPDGIILASSIAWEMGTGYVAPADSVIREAALNRRGVKLISILDRKALLHGITVFQNTMLWFMLAVLAMWLLLLSMILGKVTRSLTHLRESMDAVQHGSLSIHAEVETKDELAEIAAAFNSMVERIRLSDEAREIQTRERIQAIDMQRVAEIAALENQINSHFLYNTLNTIHYTAMEGALDKVSLQIRQLAGCLRYTFEKNSRVVTLSREIEWLQQYLYLQKQRYGKTFDYDIQVDDDVLDWPVRKLLIQPFLENAILHGFEGRRSGGMLQVRFRLFHGTRLWVTIEDNGNGMSATRLERLRQLFSGSENPSDVGIGLENVHYRIRTYYGGEGRVTVSSAEGQGTRFTLLLPKLISDNPTQR